MITYGSDVAMLAVEYKQVFPREWKMNEEPVTRAVVEAAHAGIRQRVKEELVANPDLTEELAVSIAMRRDASGSGPGRKRMTSSGYELYRLLGLWFDGGGR